MTSIRRKRVNSTKIIIIIIIIIFFFLKMVAKKKLLAAVGYHLSVGRERGKKKNRPWW